MPQNELKPTQRFFCNILSLTDLLTLDLGFSFLEMEDLWFKDYASEKTFYITFVTFGECRTPIC
jgi:hypothetical protein